jgi:hypothetical protein
MKQKDYEKEPWTNDDYPIFTPLVLAISFAGLLVFSSISTLLTHMGTSDVAAAAQISATFLYATAAFVCGWGLFSSAFAFGVQIEKWRQKREKRKQRERDDQVQKVKN